MAKPLILAKGTVQFYFIRKFRNELLKTEVEMETDRKGLGSLFTCSLVKRTFHSRKKLVGDQLYFEFFQTLPHTPGLVRDVSFVHIPTEVEC